MELPKCTECPECLEMPYCQICTENLQTWPMTSGVKARCLLAMSYFSYFYLYTIAAEPSQQQPCSGSNKLERHCQHPPNQRALARQPSAIYSQARPGFMLSGDCELCHDEIKCVHRTEECHKVCQNCSNGMLSWNDSPSYFF